MCVGNRPGTAEHMAKYPQYVVEGPEKWQRKWRERFGNNHSIHVKVGPSKGRSTYEIAKTHPEINCIGIDMQLSILSIALDKLVAEPLSNLQLLRVDDEALTEYLAENEVDLIYLSFSDSWPKKKHEKCRLMYKSFLATDEIILKPNGEIHFKTDNQGLFECSLSSFSRYGMIIERVWLDLHNGEFEGSIMTEYEEKFFSRGQWTYRIEVRFVVK